MVITDPVALEEKRKKILELSMASANEPRFGYFGFTSPLAVGENSKAPRFKKMTEDEFRKPNILTNPSKKGMTLDTMFQFIQPLCIGDPYNESAGAVKRDKVKVREGEEQFRPAGAVKFNLSGGIEYIPSGEGTRQRHKIDPVIMPNIVTNPGRKGGAGTIVPGVLFGFGEERRFPEHVPDDYEIASKLKRAELKKETENKIHEQAFRGCGYGNGTFQNNVEAFHCEQPYGIPLPEQPSKTKVVAHEGAFRPVGNIKTGPDGYLQPFPEWQPDPVPQPRRRAKDAVASDKESWKVGAPVEVSNPQPAVQMMQKNLRSEFPQSFQRPVLN